MDYRMTGVVFRCHDVPKLAEFYETVLEFPRQRPPVGEPVKNQVYYRFEPGVVIELLGPGEEVPPVSKREDVPATPLLRVDDIEPIVERLREHKVRIVTEPAQVEGSSARLVTFLDPEGHHICIFQM